MDELDGLITGAIERGLIEKRADGKYSATADMSLVANYLKENGRDEYAALWRSVLSKMMKNNHTPRSVLMTQEQANNILAELRALDIVCEFSADRGERPYECIQGYAPVDDPEDADPWNKEVDGKSYFGCGVVTMQDGRYRVRVWGAGDWDCDTAKEAAEKVTERMDAWEAEDPGSIVA